MLSLFSEREPISQVIVVPIELNQSELGEKTNIGQHIIANTPVAKKGIFCENFGSLSHKETTINNSSFVETLLKDLTKQILSSNDFKTIFTKQIQEQPGK